MPIVLKGKKNNIELQVPGCSGGGGSGGVSSVNGQTGDVVIDVPSKVSELENDAGYLTQHQSLDALATKEALNNGLAAKQDKLTAGANITIENNVISASGSGIGGTSNHSELSNLDFAHSGHTGFASTEDIPTKLSQLQNDSQFITSASVPTKVSQLANDKNYATTSQIPTKISQLDNDKSYLTSTTADAQGYVKQTELDKKQDKLTAGSGIIISDNNTITATTTYTLPIAGQGQLGGVALYGHKDETNVYSNDFTINQSNGIIEMRPAEKVISKPDTMDQATYTNYVKDFHLGGIKLKPTSLLTVDDDGYIDVYTAGLKSEIVPTNVGAFTNDAGYITQEAIPTVPTKVSELQNDSNFITNSDIPTNVSAFTNDAGYLTEHQNLDAYATKTELATGLAEKQATLTAGANITIENNVISASGGGSEPDAYIKSASVSGNTLTLTNKDNTTVAFTPSGGGGLENLTDTAEGGLKGKDASSAGRYSLAIGYSAKAPQIYSLAFGWKAEVVNANNDNSDGGIAIGHLCTSNSCGGVAIGVDSKAYSRGRMNSGECNMAIGHRCKAGVDGKSDSYNIALNNTTIAQGNSSLACGQDTKTLGSYGSFAQGRSTTATHASQHVEGTFNILDASTEEAYNKGTYAHIVGNGTSPSALSNAYTLDWQGNGTFAGTITSSTGADYAEFFEWMDGNPDNEDRIGYIVALNGNKIELANSVDDVLGICSGTAMVLGDSAEWNWNKRYLTDDFGRVLYSDYNIEHPATYDNEGEILDDAWTEHIHVPTPNPAYDASKTYIRRSERPEWQIVGLMGKLYVRDNGTCVVNGYAGVSNGIAIKSDNKTNMRVMERINDTVIRVLLK